MTEIRQQYLCFVMGLLCDFRTFSPLSVVELWSFFLLAGGGGLYRLSSHFLDTTVIQWMTSHLNRFCPIIGPDILIHG